VLGDDRDVGNDRARIESVARYGSGVIEVVEKQMLGPLRRHHEAVWSNRTAILKEDGNLHVRIGVTGVNMQTVSWLVMKGAGPVLSPGMKPSAIAQYFRPMVVIGCFSCVQRGFVHAPTMPSRAA